MKKFFTLSLLAIFGFFTLPFTVNGIDYKKRMKLSKSFYYYKGMGDYYRQKKDYAKSVKNYEYALVLNSESAECYFYLGKIKYEKGVYIDAIKELEVAATKEFEYPLDRVRNYYLMATIYFKVQKDGQALDIINHLINEYQSFNARSYQIQLIDPSHYAPAFFLMGLYLRNNGQLDDKKISYFENSIRLNYKKDFCNYFISEYYKTKNKDDLAFRYYHQAMILNAGILEDIKSASWKSDYDLFEDLEYEYLEKHNQFVDEK